ncbi:MAG: ChaN family lipoprotein [Thermodesulfobacteriota bacterium]
MALTCRSASRKPHPFFYPAVLIFLAVLTVSGCVSGPQTHLEVKSMDAQYRPDTILSASRKEAVSFDTMMAKLKTARIVYVGESHTNAAHHEIQLEILKHLYRHHGDDLIVGMEMFARPYQDKLLRWSSGQMSEELFLQQTHWYANWQYDFSLYRDLMRFIKDKGVFLAALNVPFHIPGKIAAGGIETLHPHEKSHLPDQIDMSNEKHRQYVKEIFQQHDHGRKRYRFENFYAAQCVWEDAMAEAVSHHIDDNVMVVFAGNGHITHKFGIPERARTRNQLPYQTVMPKAAGSSVELSAADYIWVTPQKSHPMPH